MAGERIEGGVDEVFRADLLEVDARPGFGTVSVIETIRGDLATPGVNDRVVESWNNTVWRFHARTGVSLPGPELAPGSFGLLCQSGQAAAFEVGFGTPTGIAISAGTDASSTLVPNRPLPDYPGMNCLHARLLAADAGEAWDCLAEVQVALGDAGTPMRWLYHGHPGLTGSGRFIFREGQAVPDAAWAGWWMYSWQTAVMRNSVAAARVLLRGPNLHPNRRVSAVLCWNAAFQPLTQGILPGQTLANDSGSEIVHDAGVIAMSPPFVNSYGRLLAAVLISQSAWNPADPAAPADAAVAWIARDVDESVLLIKTGQALPDGSTVNWIPGPDDFDRANPLHMASGDLVLVQAMVSSNGIDRAALLIASLSLPTALAA